MFKNKKAWHYTSSPLSLILGIIVFLIGIVPLLSQWNIIPFGLPAFVTNIVGMIAVYLIAAAGLYLLIDGFLEDNFLRAVTIIIALVFIIIGLIQILNNFGVIGFSIPFMSPFVYNIVFTLEGLGLIIGAFAMM